MPFLNGSLGFERFRVTGTKIKNFSQDHIEALEKNASSNLSKSLKSEAGVVGFSGGDHIFDTDFAEEKNIIGDALHFAVRIDTNQVPSAIRKAWLTMELAALTRENATRRPTKAQREEAKEAVEARCEAELETGKYRKTQHYPLLWDARRQILYVAASGDSVVGHCTEIFESAFEVELERISAGKLACEWGQDSGNEEAIDLLAPTSFISENQAGELTWANPHSVAPDFIGNEFLMWLWWHLESESETLTLADETEITAMLTKTLSLECPYGENGKETIAAESPVVLAEARQAIASGKLPRKTGMTLVRQGQQFDLVLQAETFAVSGAKIHLDEGDDPYDLEARIESIRSLSEGIDLLLHRFCEIRVSKKWNKELKKIQNWIGGFLSARQAAA